MSEVNTCIIDSITRKINVPEDVALLGVQHDRNSNAVRFQMNQWPTQIFDMNLAEVRVVFKNSNNEIGSYLVTDKSVSDGICTFTWVVSASAVQDVEFVKFIVCARIMDGKNVAKEWNTLIATGSVGECLPHDSTIIEKEDYDEVMQLMNYVNEMVESVKTTTEAAKAEIGEVSGSTVASINLKEQEAVELVDMAKDDAVDVIQSLIDTLGLRVKEGKVCQTLKR